MNRVASSDPNVTRPEDRLNEVCNLVLLKLESDRQAAAGGPDAYVKWQVREDPADTARHIRAWFSDFTRLYPDLFSDEREKTLRFADETIHMVVEKTERYLLLEVGSEAVAQAFQVLRAEALRLADGQFFTPRQVIEAGTALVGIRWEDLVIDPACGTGGFLIEAFLQVLRHFSGDQREAARWAQQHVYGVDRDAVGVKLAKAVMQIVGDGSAHIFRGDSIRRHQWDEHYPSLKANLQEGRFDVVLTNPPFGRPLRVARGDLRRAGYTIHRRPDGSEAESVEIGLVFLDLAHWLLKPGGRVGIVLPETYFFSTSYHWLFDWLRERFRPLAVVNVPMEAFQQYARAKTNFYVFKKLEAGEDPEGGEVVFLNPRTCGIDPAGKVTESNELKDHVDAFLRGELPDGGSRVSLKEVYARRVLVPTYYDTRYVRPLLEFLEREGLHAVSLGELVEEGVLSYRYGHGSPDRLSRRGEIPYIKVSDLRAGRVNVNPTNLVPVEVAKRLWRGEESGLRAWDLLTPARASSNIGEFSVLLPGEECRVLTREILVLRVEKEKHGIDPFYLFWALSLKVVRESWRRVVLMQTNREDIGERWREVLIPRPKSPEWARQVSEPLRKYLGALQEARSALVELREQGYEFVAHLFASPDCPSGRRTRAAG
ncbi:N-6 DNA methylase [Ammonifex degensii]|uniref:N-6 DNA methylase n=1 Tax=Ammonifex degensii TaxID=42838 RepID=UPI00145F94C6|nr:N-6 DNA methylase [Ammonifex degensii]